MPDVRGAGGVWPPLEHRLDLARCGVVVDAGLVARPGQLVGIEDRGEVDQGAARL